MFNVRRGSLTHFNLLPKDTGDLKRYPPVELLLRVGVRGFLLQISEKLSES